MSDKKMNVTASSEGREVSTEGVWKKPSETLEIKIRNIDSPEGIALGFRQEMFALTDKKGNGGRVSTSAGLGGEAIILTWKDKHEERRAVIRGSELLLAWVATFQPEIANIMRKAVEGI
jgi:hypothetical protein